MKKKFLTFAIAFACALSGALMLTACNDVTKDHCKISIVETLPSQIKEVQYSPSKGHSNGKQSYSYFTRGEESTIEITLKEGYEIADYDRFLKINDQFVTVVDMESNGGIEERIEYTFTPAENIAIDFDSSAISDKVLTVALFVADGENNGFKTNSLGNFTISTQIEGNNQSFVANTVLGPTNAKIYQVPFGKTFTTTLAYNENSYSIICGDAEVRKPNGEYFNWSTETSYTLTDGALKQEILVKEDLAVFFVDNMAFPTESNAFGYKINAMEEDFEDVSLFEQTTVFNTEMFKGFSKGDNSSKAEIKFNLRNTYTFEEYSSLEGLAFEVNGEELSAEDFLLTEESYSTVLTLKLKKPHAYYQANDPLSFENNCCWNIKTNLFDLLVNSGKAEWIKLTEIVCPPEYYCDSYAKLFNIETIDDVLVIGEDCVEYAGLAKTKTHQLIKKEDGLGLWLNLVTSSNIDQVKITHHDDTISTFAYADYYDATLHFTHLQYHTTPDSVEIICEDFVVINIKVDRENPFKSIEFIFAEN